MAGVDLNKYGIGFNRDRGALVLLDTLKPDQTKALEAAINNKSIDDVITQLYNDYLGIDANGKPVTDSASKFTNAQKQLTQAIAAETRPDGKALLQEAQSVLTQLGTQYQLQAAAVAPAAPAKPAAAPKAATAADYGLTWDKDHFHVSDDKKFKDALGDPKKKSDLQGFLEAKYREYLFASSDMGTRIQKVMNDSKNGKSDSSASADDQLKFLEYNIATQFSDELGSSISGLGKTKSGKPIDEEDNTQFGVKWSTTAGMLSQDAVISLTNPDDFQKAISTDQGKAQVKAFLKARYESYLLKDTTKYDDNFKKANNNITKVTGAPGSTQATASRALNVLETEILGEIKNEQDARTSALKGRIPQNDLNTLLKTYHFNNVGDVATMMRGLAYLPQDYNISNGYSEDLRSKIVNGFASLQKTKMYDYLTNNPNADPDRKAGGKLEFENTYKKYFRADLVTDDQIAQGCPLLRELVENAAGIFTKDGTPTFTPQANPPGNPVNSDPNAGKADSGNPAPGGGADNGDGGSPAPSGGGNGNGGDTTSKTTHPKAPSGDDVKDLQLYAMFAKDGNYAPLADLPVSNIDSQGGRVTGNSMVAIAQGCVDGYKGLSKGQIISKFYNSTPAAVGAGYDAAMKSDEAFRNAVLAGLRANIDKNKGYVTDFLTKHGVDVSSGDLNAAVETYATQVGATPAVGAAADKTTTVDQSAAVHDFVMNSGRTDKPVATPAPVNSNINWDSQKVQVRDLGDDRFAFEVPKDTSQADIDRMADEAADGADYVTLQPQTKGIKTEHKVLGIDHEWYGANKASPDALQRGILRFDNDGHVLITRGGDDHTPHVYDLNKYLKTQGVGDFNQLDFMPEDPHMGQITNAYEALSRRPGFDASTGFVLRGDGEHYQLHVYKDTQGDMKVSMISQGSMPAAERATPPEMLDAKWYKKFNTPTDVDRMINDSGMYRQVKPIGQAMETPKESGDLTKTFSANADKPADASAVPKAEPADPKTDKAVYTPPTTTPMTAPRPR